MVIISARWLPAHATDYIRTHTCTYAETEDAYTTYRMCELIFVPSLIGEWAFMNDVDWPD